MNINGLDLFLACATLALATVLWRACMIDLAEYRLPDRLVLPLIPAGLIVTAVRTGTWPVEAALAVVVCFALFYLLGELYFRARGVEGLGIGDAKLFAAAAAWLAPALLPLVVLGAAVPAILVLVLSDAPERRLAFGPYLSGAFLLLWIWSVYLST